MDGLLIIDKPSGPTSHDVVARMRRVLGERRVGHTGTLDPLASGVLPLLVGRATRLARFMNTSGKAYEAVVRLGVSTDTADAEGTPIGSRFGGALPSRDHIERALDAFRGTFLQQPPAFSAKKIGGQRSYKLARDTRQLCSRGGGAPPQSRTDADAAPPDAASPRVLPTHVIVNRLELVALDNDLVTLSLDCSAGFYVRSLAHDLGQALGTGAHLAQLRRSRSGGLTLDASIPLADAEADPARAQAAIVPLAGMLPELRTVVLTPDGVRHAVQGRHLGPRDLGFGIGDSEDKSQAESPLPNPESPYVRLFDEAGALVGIARPSPPSGSLHPFVVLM